MRTYLAAVAPPQPPPMTTTRAAVFGHDVALHAARAGGQPGDGGGGEAEPRARALQEIAARDPRHRLSSSPGRRIAVRVPSASLDAGEHLGLVTGQVDRCGHRGRRVLDPAAREHHHHAGVRGDRARLLHLDQSAATLAAPSGDVQMPSTRASSRWASTISRSLTARPWPAGLAQDLEHLPAREGAGHAQARRIGDGVLPERRDVRALSVHALTTGAQPSACTATKARLRGLDPPERGELVVRLPDADEAGAAARRVDEDVGRRPSRAARPARAPSSSCPRGGTAPSASRGRTTRSRGAMPAISLPAVAMVPSTVKTWAPASTRLGDGSLGGARAAPRRPRAAAARRRRPPPPRPRCPPTGSSAP